FSQRLWYRSRLQSLAFFHHAHDLLLAARDKFFAAVRKTPIFEDHRYAILRERSQTHSNGQFVERRNLVEVLARTSSRYQTQSLHEQPQDVRGMVLQKHFPASALPLDVMRVVDVSQKIRLFKTHHVSVLVRSHCLDL